MKNRYSVYRKPRPIIWLISTLILTLMASPAIGQNCDVDFPGTANLTFSAVCGSAPANVTLGKTTKFGNGDVLTFNSDVTITGNVVVNAEGSGKMVIPAGVDVNIEGNVQLNNSGGCTSGNPCVFEIVVTGTLHIISSNFQNNINTLVWSGTGTVIFDDHFDNSSNACMQCGSGGCPVFQGDPSDCKDNGSGCSQGDFCTAITTCASDVTPPTITGCPSNISVNMTGSTCTQPVTWTPPTPADNCSMGSFKSTHNPGFAFPKGPTTVTYTATDSKGNTATCSFTVTVNDVIAPVINACPANMSVNTTSSCGAVVTLPAVAFTDNCTGGSIASVPASGSTLPVGPTTVVYTATDAAGNTATCSFIVTVVDVTAPVFTNCPTEIKATGRPESCDAVVSWSVPTATDNCDNPITPTSIHSPGNVFPIGTTPVKYTATDLAGNSSFCEFNVIVTNETIPVISGCPENITARADESGEVAVTWVEPTATVACGDVTLTATHYPGYIFSAGEETEVTYTANTLHGKTAVCKFNVKVSVDIEFEITPVVTPNGDGTNDYWELTNIEKFESNKVVVADRWGNVIYKASGYNNDNVVWRGENTQGTRVPTGTYFYTISVDAFSNHVEKRGSVEVIR